MLRKESDLTVVNYIHRVFGKVEGFGCFMDISIIEVECLSSHSIYTVI